MALGLVDDSCFTDIANSIRSKLGSSDSYKPSEMAAAIDSISGGEPTPVSNGFIKIPKYARLEGTGYISGGTWIYGTTAATGGLCATDLYQVEANKTYLLCLGSNVGTRFRTAFFTTDISTVTSNVTGTMIIDQNSPTSFTFTKYTPTTDGYIAIGVTNQSEWSITSYLYECTQTGVI